MQIYANHLAAHLKQGLRSLYTVHGNEPLLVQEAVDAIRATARQAGFTERTSHTAQGASYDWGEVVAATQSLSLFADRQIIEIHVPGGKPGKEGSLALQQVAESTQGNDGTLVIVTLPRLDKQTRASAWFVALENQGVTVPVESVERNALPQWISQRLRLQGQHVAAGAEGEHALRFFADRVEGNLRAAHQEVQKLGLLYPHGELSAQQIEAAVLNVARYDVFKLSEAVLAGQFERVQRMMDGLQAEGESEVLVHYALAEDIRALKRVREALDQGKPLPMALREQRIWGMRERLFERVAPRMTSTSLAGLLHAAHVVDGIVKGIKSPDWPVDSWQALQRLALQLCRQATEARPR